MATSSGNLGDVSQLDVNEIVALLSDKERFVSRGLHLKDVLAVFVQKFSANPSAHGFHVAGRVLELSEQIYSAKVDDLSERVQSFREDLIVIETGTQQPSKKSGEKQIREKRPKPQQAVVIDIPDEVPVYDVEENYAELPSEENEEREPEVVEEVFKPAEFLDAKRERNCDDGKDVGDSGYNHKPDAVTSLAELSACSYVNERTGWLVESFLCPSMILEPDPEPDFRYTDSESDSSDDDCEPFEDDDVDKGSFPADVVTGNESSCSTPTVPLLNTQTTDEGFASMPCSQITLNGLQDHGIGGTEVPHQNHNGYSQNALPVIHEREGSEDGSTQEKLPAMRQKESHSNEKLFDRREMERTVTRRPNTQSIVDVCEKMICEEEMPPSYNDLGHSVSSFVLASKWSRGLGDKIKILQKMLQIEEAEDNYAMELENSENIDVARRLADDPIHDVGLVEMADIRISDTSSPELITNGDNEIPTAKISDLPSPANAPDSGSESLKAMSETSDLDHGYASQQSTSKNTTPREASPNVDHVNELHNNIGTTEQRKPFDFSEESKQIIKRLPLGKKIPITEVLLKPKGISKEELVAITNRQLNCLVHLANTGVIDVGKNSVDSDDSSDDDDDLCPWIILLKDVYQHAKDDDDDCAGGQSMSTIG